MSSTAKVRLEGWLIKRKSKDRPTLFKNENLRWFRIQEVEGSDQAELALCYYHSRKDKEAKGWIYLRDITQILDDKKAFTVISAARTMTLEAQSHAEHLLWVQTLANCSPFINSGKDSTRANNTQSKDVPIETVADSKSDSKQESTTSYATLSQEHLQSITKAEEKTSSMDRSISLFSRHAHGEKNSFYTQASNVGSTLNTASDDLGDVGHSLYRIESGTNFDGTSDNENSRSSSNPRPHQIPKEDHRLQGFRAGDTSGTVSGRLNKYISKDGNNKLGRLESNGEIEDVSLEEPNKLRNRNLRAQRLESRRRSGSDSDDSNQAGIAMKHNNLTGNGGSSSDDEYRNESKGSRYNSEEEEKPQKAPVIAETVNKPPQKMAPPPPTSAPPRRAKDALAEAENQKTRRSLDEILFKKENRAEAKTTEADSSDDENVDIKAEYEKYNNAADNEQASFSKPPRPQNVKPPTHNPAPVVGSNRPNKTGAYRMGTPPRPSADPGSQVDQNFVDDNWDEEDDEHISRHNYSNNDRKTSNKSNSQQEPSAGVKVDENWLEENFDD